MSGHRGLGRFSASCSARTPRPRRPSRVDLISRPRSYSRSSRREAAPDRAPCAPGDPLAARHRLAARLPAFGVGRPRGFDERRDRRPRCRAARAAAAWASDRHGCGARHRRRVSSRGASGGGWPRRARAPPARPTATISASAVSNARIASRSASASSTTRKRGSMPAAAGWEASSRRQNPWIVEIQARSIPSSALRRASSRSPSASRIRAGELLPDPATQLVRRPLGEGEGEDPARCRPRVERGGAEAVDEHPRLPGPGSGAEEDIPLAALDRRALLLGALGTHSSSPSSDQGSSSGSPRSRRQIGWKLH